MPTNAPVFAPHNTAQNKTNGPTEHCITIVANANANANAKAKAKANAVQRTLAPAHPRYQRRPTPHRQRHIARSVNIPFLELTSSANRLQFQAITISGPDLVSTGVLMCVRGMSRGSSS
jgi:hypothetical protein